MLDANTYIFTGDTGIMIDPGSTDTLPALLREMKQDGIKPEQISTIVNTHLHLDHYLANEAFKKVSGAKIFLHQLQKKYWDETVVGTTKFFGIQPIVFKEDGIIEGDTLASFKLIPSPGHSPDSICYYDEATKVLVCGDVIFAQNVGRADLPGGDAAQLKQSVEILSRLDIEYLLPGHMRYIKGARLVQANFDFIKANALNWL